MVLIKIESTFIGNRPFIMEAIEKKKKVIEIFKKGMILVEESQPTTEEVSITVVFSKKDETELKAIFDSK